ncbi:LUD domain-containing protein [Streptomyces sp. NPDC058122]|uniref:LUD domain-containing protein n=1 Tax=Streptomyces sp. NPDC058122 TaxID=3346349 RepID=UPI0036E0A766
MTASTPDTSATTQTPETHAPRATPETPATPEASFTAPATDERLERVAAALKEKNFDVEILDDATAARARVKDLIPEGAAVFTVASETLRLSGIEEDINESGRYDSVKARGTAMDRATQMTEIWRMLACPDVVVGSVAAVTETGSLVAASASGSQLPAYSGAAPRVILLVGAQKVVPDLDTALRRVDEYCVPLEDERAMKVYGVPSALNRLLVLNAEPHPGRTTVLLLREAIGF